MARYKIILAYDGTGFVGSQRQGRGRTVQGEFESALRKIGWTGRTILLAGRTDTGVHASGQVAVFDLDWDHGLDDLHKALNSNLPQDMAVRSVDLALAGFHPRFDAASRRYRYHLFCARVRDPLRERYAWRIWPPVADLAPLAELWPGTHDFAPFGSPPRPDGNRLATSGPSRFRPMPSSTAWCAAWSLSRWPPGRAGCQSKNWLRRWQTGRKSWPASPRRMA
jgi:tRNA pseudouridine38-40 synthase